MIVRKSLFIALAALFVSLILVSTSMAQDTLLISYQGRLTDDGGNPVSGTPSMTFTIYDGAGVSKWTETHPTVSVDNGLFSVILGSQMALSNSVFNGDDRYLGITVDGDPEISPRTLFTSTASAAYAKRVAGDISTDDGMLLINDLNGDSSIVLSSGVGDNIGRIGFMSPGDDDRLLEISANHLTEETNIRFVHPPEKDFMTFSGIPSTGANIKMFNPQPEPPARMFEMGVVNDGSEWSSGIDMYLAHPPEYPTPAQVLSISSAPSTGASFKMFNPQPEPPALYFEINANTETGPSMSFHDDVGKVMGLEPSFWNEGFSMRFIDSGEDEDRLKITADYMTDETRINFISPGNDGVTPAIEIGTNLSNSFLNISRYDQQSSMLYEGFSFDLDNINQSVNFRLISPGNDNLNGFEIAASELTNSASFRLIDPGDDEHSLVEISGGPSTGASIYMFNPQPEPPAEVFNLSAPIGVKSSDDVIMKLTSIDGQYVTKLTPGRVKVGHSTNDLYPRSELNAGADSITFFLQGNTAVLTAPPITMISSSTEAKMGIGNISPTSQLVVGDNLGSFGGTRIIVGDATAGTESGLVIGEDNSYRSWILWNVDNNTLGMGTKEGASVYGNTLVLNSGEVGVGTNTPNYTLDVRGTIGNNTTLYHSDKRWKRDIQKLNGSLDRVMKLQGVHYKWKQDKYPEMNFPDGDQIGLIAQDVEKIIPEVVNESADGYKSIEYAKLTSILIEAIKELKKDNEDLRSINNELSKRVEALEKAR